MEYTFSAPQFLDLDALRTALFTLPIVGISQSNTLTVYCSRELTTEEQQSLSQAISAARPRLNLPVAVTPRQMRIALVLSGISIAVVESAIDALPEPDRSVTRITWEYSTEFQRTNPLLVAMAPVLGLTEENVDQLFMLASTL